MGTRRVEPGTLLADRYVVEDLLAQDGESQSWRARDLVLARSVVLHLLPSAAPLAADMLTAAKRAARVADPRILQVLDAVDDGELTYVVREWATGQSLDVILTEGPLSARRTTWLVREVAGALSNAHRMGLPHRRLAPDTIVITKSSGVKVIGLGTFAALRRVPDEAADPELQDTLDLGRVLYACLTARWPGNGYKGLPPAPTEHGRLLRPRQVRAGVPRPLDVVCDRILGSPPHAGAAITTVAEVQEVLAEISAHDGFPDSAGVGLALPPGGTVSTPEGPPALLGSGSGGARTAERPMVRATRSGVGDDPPSLRRTLMWTAVAVLVAGAILLAYLIGQNLNAAAPSSSAPPSDSTSSTSLAHSITIQGVRDFDPPPGSGHENPGEVGLAIDNNPATAWETLRYDRNPRLGGLKSGVGLILDLGRSQEVDTVTVSLQGDGTSLQLRAAPASAIAAPTGSADAYTLVGDIQHAGNQARFAPAKAVVTRFLLVWLTSLPAVGAYSYRGRIANIEVAG
ncbi:MAG: protein kinase family protein [Nocardioidaceae bacterium]